MENLDMIEIRKALSDIQTNLQGLQQEIQGVKTELQQEIQGVKTELHQEIQGVKTELHQEIQGVKTELHQEIQYLTILVEQDTNKKIEALFDGRVDELRYREILKVTVGKVDNHEMRIDILEKASRVS